ncbi:MAG TPA: hypothetical protein VHR86_00480, partial [Armatimonadota bacterium]|nr:hypothetical protein [Armatimonadota bacterium]
QIRAGVIRPEVIVPRRATSSTAAPDNSDLEIGTRVRVIREPYFGRLASRGRGTILRLNCGGTGETPVEYLSMWAYLWDLLDEGIDQALRQMREEAGVNTVSLAVAYHTVQHLRPRATGKKYFVSREASLYFHPDRKRYRDTSLQPRVSPLVIGSNPLREVAERCNAQGMGLIAWTVTLHNSYLGAHYPEVTVRNVFGDSIQEALCPAQEAVRAYVRGLVEDLTANYPLAGVELESLGYPCARHYHCHEKIGIALGPLEQFLLSLCFCPACRRRLEGQVDVEAAARAVRETILSVLERGEPTGQSLPDYLAMQPAVASYLNAQRGIVTSLVQEVKAVCRTRLIYMDTGDWWGGGVDLPTVGHLADRLEILSYTPDARRTRDAIRRAAAATGGAERVTVGFSCFPPASPNPEALYANVRAAAECGVGALSFYHYGIMPPRNLLWVRQALALQ